MCLQVKYDNTSTVSANDWIMKSVCYVLKCIQNVSLEWIVLDHPPPETPWKPISEEAFTRYVEAEDQVHPWEHYYVSQW